MERPRLIPRDLFVHYKQRRDALLARLDHAQRTGDYAGEQECKVLLSVLVIEKHDAMAHTPRHKALVQSGLRVPSLQQSDHHRFCPWARAANPSRDVEECDCDGLRNADMLEAGDQVRVLVQTGEVER